MPLKDGLLRAIAYADETGHNTAQVFPGNPTGWQHVPLRAEVAAAVRTEAQARQVLPLVIHAPHIINLASPDADLAARSIRGTLNALDRAAEIGAAYVIVHAGSHKGDGEAAGIARLAQAVERVLATAPTATLLIENSAGAGHLLGGTPAALGTLLAALPPQVGACLDTAHLWGGGTAIDSADAVEAALEEIERTVGTARVCIVHLNDSATTLGSHRDLHAHLGEGQIGLEGLMAWMRHPALCTVPLLLETPFETTAAREAARCALALRLLDGDRDGAAAHLAALQLPDLSPEGLGAPAPHPSL